MSNEFHIMFCNGNTYKEDFAKDKFDHQKQDFEDFAIKLSESALKDIDPEYEFAKSKLMIGSVSRKPVYSCVGELPLASPVNPDADEDYEFNKYELMGYSHETSLILQAADAFGKSISEVFAQLARAFCPIVDYITELWDGLELVNASIEKKHFDGVYSKPKMFEYYKTRPNVLNLNSRIRKVRNLL